MEENKAESLMINLDGKIQQKPFEETTEALPNCLEAYSEILLNEIHERKERGKRYRFVGLDFGFNHFNKDSQQYRISQLNFVLNGLNPELYVIAGGTSVGKTTFLRQMMDEIVLWNNWVNRKENSDKSTYVNSIEYMRQKFPEMRKDPLNEVVCIYFSYEQGINELQFKSLSRLYQINSGKIYKGTLTDNDFEKIWGQIEFINKLGRFQYIVEADYKTTIDKILRISKRIKEDTKAKYAVIFIDYLQIIPANNQGDSRGIIEYNISELRRIARKEKFPVVAISSVARGKGDKAGTDTGKESGLIEFTADVYMNLIKDGDNNDGYREIALSIDKNRNGAQKVIHWAFTPSYSEYKQNNDKKIPQKKDVTEEETEGVEEYDSFVKRKNYKSNGNKLND